VVSERIVDRPGLATPGEDAAWEALRQRVTISLRPIGAPTPIGLFCLAAATFVLSGLSARSGSPSSLSCWRRSSASWAAMTWLVVGLVLDTSPPGSTSAVLGLFLIFTGTAMTMTGLTAAVSKLVPAAVFLLAALRFFTTAGYELSGDRAWEKTAGVLGLVLFALALYAAWAAELEDALGRTVLPFGRRGKGNVAVHGSLLEQVKDIPPEPGVRTKL
jgi:succinate-acetate transporter protein